MEETPLPLYAQNPQQRFSNRANDYAKYRPSYPAAAIDQILSGLESPTAADVGAGTGISARLLAERGVKVWAIEPNAAMYAAAQSHPLVEFRQGTAEQTGLDSRSVDVITCCQAFHWFEPIATLSEFHRILKPGGRLALMWNERDETDEFTREQNEIIRRAADHRFFDSPERKSATPLAESALFTDFGVYSFPYRHLLNLEGMIGLALSSSYIPKSGEGYDQMIREFRLLYQRWARSDSVPLVYRTNLYVAEANEK
jgi:SAM-dependent methyltransferase